MEERPVSRIRQYVDAQAKRDEKVRMADLEGELDQSERRTLRLNKELLNETTLRIRSENERDKLSEEIEYMKRRVGVEVIGVEDSVKRPQRIVIRPEDVGTSGKVSRSRRPAPSVSRTPAEPIPINSRGDRVENVPKQSSRKRGGVK